MKIGRWSSVTNKRCAAKNFLPQVMWKYHCLVTASWTEAFCVAGRLALVVLMFAFRHRFVRLWHEFCRLWREFVQELRWGTRLGTSVRQWPWAIMCLTLALRLISILVFVAEML